MFLIALRNKIFDKQLEQNVCSIGKMLVSGHRFYNQMADTNVYVFELENG